MNVSALPRYACPDMTNQPGKSGLTLLQTKPAERMLPQWKRELDKKIRTEMRSTVSR